MSSTLQDSNINVRTYPVRLRGRGQITVPQTVRDNLQVTEGDVLTLLQAGDLILLTPKQPKVPELADKIVALMEAENVTLADLLLGLEEERQAIWQERHQDA
jgi:bifunctional DNA-binding transcriptional regulator/antitoxin component of YhaV-PrlF toxin-antitoxin module